MQNSLMKQAQFNRVLSRAIAWPLLAMAGLAAVSVWQVGRLLSATRWVEHTAEIISHARQSQKQVSDIQSGLRSYHLTHDRQFYQRYVKARAEYDRQEQFLDRLIVDSPAQQQRLALLRAAFAKWFDVLGRYKAVPSRDFIPLSKPASDALSSRFDSFIAFEQTLRQDRMRAAQREAVVALITALCAAAVLGLFLAYANRRQLLALSGSYERQSEALQASEERLAITLQSIGDGVVAADAQGRITFLNPVAEHLTGWTLQEAHGKDLPEVFTVVHESTRTPVKTPIATTGSDRQPNGSSMHALLARDGRVTPIDDIGTPIRDNNNETHGVVLVFHDVSERRRLESQLLQAQKMESVGRLAGGVAHDFNNLLTAVLGYAELTEAVCHPESEARTYVRHVIQAADRAANLTRQLLSFARRQIIEPKIVNLNDLVLGLDKMLRRLIGEQTELVILPCDELHAVKVDPGQFEQIVVNLVVNARDAMPNGGKITIETQNATLDCEYARQHEGVTPGEYVVLAVSDTGSGMEEAIRLHIFEPFFTTKEHGRGTGLGLATVYGIVKQAGGHIWLYSEAGEGTTFRIYLPRTAEFSEAVVVETAQCGRSGGSETILLVEDEPIVRALAVQALRNYGYRVNEAMNGEDALRLVAGHEVEIDLLITDVVMPRLNGNELAERLQAVNPNVKVLYASGYTENTIVHHGVLMEGVAFLPKPFTPTLLARKVREVLDAVPV